MRLSIRSLRQVEQCATWVSLGGLSSYGMAINSYNHVAGYSTPQTNNERVHAFLHDGNSMIDLGSLGRSRQLLMSA